MGKKYLLVGNHSCSNRGDAAITRGLLETLENLYPDSKFDVCSRFSYGASQILEREVIQDSTDTESNIIYRLIRKVSRKIGLDYIVLLAIFTTYLRPLKIFLPTSFKKMVNLMSKYDGIIHVGGSFFVDLYGLSQYRLVMCSILAKKNVVLIGHSIGPFDQVIYKRLSNFILNKAKFISLRDTDSVKLIHSSIPTLKYEMGADTAFLVDSKTQLNQKQDNLIGFTFRKLAPFDVRLGISQSRYENVMASACATLIENGYCLKFLSTCTSFDHYHNDDRIIAERIKSLIPINLQKNVEVVTDELTDMDLGREISKCKLLVGTRLHSAIIAMNFGTPAISISYEHKASGLFDFMDLSELSFSLSQSFNQNQIISRIESVLLDYEAWAQRVENSTCQQRRIAKNSIDDAISTINDDF
ncbi:polysaccharide pyruvyl transferase family protein [Vibrio viridaestus]|uniref:Polysaccharide pyruvyl transferase domain-containing protein n=1 Tax=Vibrio viridaestus TaxID=2487322 RepID=A0A3N9THV7_9VIBR|nr:polysaccharide pyruvyl transferase family protein [Vibrio viridaestus]RQW63878.1 hypothetical protein EES38_04530 [Vibrio viridaestus]